MDLIIRGLDPATVKKIDELARKSKLSRQVYLKNHLESFAVNDLHTDLLDRYEKQLKANMILLEKTNNTVDEMMITFKDIMEDE